MKRLSHPPLSFPTFHIEPQTTTYVSGEDLQEVQGFLYHCVQQAISQQNYVLWVTAQTDLPPEVTQFQQRSPYFYVLQKNRLSVLLEQPDVLTFTSKWQEHCEQYPVDFLIMDDINEISCHQSDAIQSFFTATRYFQERPTLIVGAQETNARAGIQAIRGTFIQTYSDFLLSIEGRSGHIAKNRYGKYNVLFTF